MHVSVRSIADWLLQPRRAVDNARAATTALSRLRVEREEVALYFEERQDRSA